MHQMFFGLPLRNRQKLSQLMGGEQCAGEQLEEALAGSLFGGPHAAIIGQRSVDEKAGIGQVYLDILSEISGAIPRLPVTKEMV